VGQGGFEGHGLGVGNHGRQTGRDPRGQAGGGGIGGGGLNLGIIPSQENRAVGIDQIQA
jgi:hypothetical protein